MLIFICVFVGYVYIERNGVAVKFQIIILKVVGSNLWSRHRLFCLILWFSSVPSGKLRDIPSECFFHFTLSYNSKLPDLAA
jgi:hypothetical protein